MSQSINYETFNQLKKRMENKFDFLLERFFSDGQTYVQTIEDSIDKESLKALIEAAHNLKSSSGLLGFIELHKFAEDLEYKGRKALEHSTVDFTELKSIADDLNSAFKAVMLELTK